MPFPPMPPARWTGALILRASPALLGTGNRGRLTSTSMAQRMAAELEAKATRQIVTAARRSLRDRMTAAEVARQLGL